MPVEFEPQIPLLLRRARIRLILILQFASRWSKTLIHQEVCHLDPRFHRYRLRGARIKLILILQAASRWSKALIHQDVCHYNLSIISLNIDFNASVIYTGEKRNLLWQDRSVVCITINYTHDHFAEPKLYCSSSWWVWSLMSSKSEVWCHLLGQ